MATPPNKCLRGTVRISAAAATNMGTNIDVPVAVFIYASNIGVKPEITYQKANADWVEISKPSTIPGIYEHPMALMASEIDAEVVALNSIGLKEWTVRQFQQWASDNLYAFFKPLVAPPVSAPDGSAITSANFVNAVNGALADLFTLVDTNGDGIPEFHGR